MIIRNSEKLLAAVTLILFLSVMLVYGVILSALEASSEAYDAGYNDGASSVVVEVKDDAEEDEFFPLFLQEDVKWSSVAYGGGNIGSHGCGLVSASIALSGITGDLVFPDELSSQSGDSFITDGINDSDKICSWIASNYEVEWSGEKWTFEDLEEMLDNGYVVIASLAGKLGDSAYTGHIVLVYKHTDDDCFLIRDPASGSNSIHKFSRAEVEEVNWGSFNGIR